MRTWILPWFFPVGLVGGLVLLTRGSIVAELLALVWGLVLIPAVTFVLLRSGPDGRQRCRELETDYWRTDGR